jgi:hypothetical protein
MPSHTTPISILTVILVFGVALVVALIWGTRWAYVAVFLPTLLLLNQVPEIDIQHAPVTAPYAPMYAILLALPFRGESLRFKLCTTDVIVLLVMLSGAITGWTTEFMETGINALRNDVLRLAMPYFLARIVFQDWRARRQTLWVLVGLVLFISFFAAVEFRMIPYWYLHLLHDRLGMGNIIHDMAYNRYGFFRVSGTVDHPIYFGNMFVVILGMLAVLAWTSGVSLRNRWVALSMLASVCCVVVSISYTPYMGIIAGGLALAALMGMPRTRRLLLPGTLAIIALLFSYTYVMAKAPLVDRADKAAGNGIEASLETRQLIIREGWAKSVEAGPFGFGLRADFSSDTDFDLASVDNSYLQFTMTRGWVYTLLWVLIGVSFAARATVAFKHLSDPSQAFPLAVASATVLGLMVSMYTVWAGALYTVLWFMMLGLSNTLIDQVMAASAARQGQGSVGPLRPPMVRMPARAAAVGAGYGA